MVMLLKRCPRGRQWGWKPAPGGLGVGVGEQRQEGCELSGWNPMGGHRLKPLVPAGRILHAARATKETQKC